MLPALFSSVRGRLVLLVSVVALPALLLASALTYIAYRHERELVSQKLSHTARAAARVIDGEIEASMRVLEILAASRELREKNFAGLDALARAVLARHDRWFSLTDSHGQQLINTRVPRGADLPRRDFPREIMESLRRERRHVSDLRPSAVSEVMTVQILLAWTHDGREAGNLAIVIPAETLQRSINVEEFQPGGVISIVDRTGRIITRNKAPERFIGAMATPDMVAAVTSLREGVQNSVTLEGIRVLTAIGRAHCGWSILIGAPEADLHASARSLLLWGLGGTAVIVALAVAMAWWIGRSMVRGVDVLAGNAKSIGLGHLPNEQSSGLQELDFVGAALRQTSASLLHRTRTLEVLNRVNTGLVAERDLEKIVQSVTDAGREASGAAFGAFFYNVENQAGESYTLFTLSGAPREAFEKFGMPRNTPVFAPTFTGQGVVRVADIIADPRYGKMGPRHGMPRGHLPVRSYLAVPVRARDGGVIGGLFFGHPEPGIFTAEAEEIVVGLAAEAAIAIENAKLLRALQAELAAKSKAEAGLRAAQAQLQHHAAELERTVEARTTSLREAVVQMEEFSSAISHDLRSPLRSMHSFASLLLEDYGPALDATAQDYLRRIVRASDRMHRMTSELLHYSRVARTQVDLAPTAVEPVVQTIVEHYAEMKPPTVVRVQSPLATVMAYEPSLTQCIGNLMTNASKFVRPGTAAQITVRTERRGSRVRIWIEDQGIGIKPEAQAKLFQVFQRVPTEARYEGTGMGLAIVRKAAEKMGGTCGVVSDGTAGSRFWIELAAG